MKNTVSILLATAVLAACSSAPRKPDYQCAIEEVEAAKCASVQDAFAASNSMQGQGHSRVQSVFDARVQPGSAPAAAAAAKAPAPVFQGQLSNHPAPSTNGDPVFQQPEVKRVWVRPYVDSNGHLRSGEYVYFSTPGKWSYGGLNKPGAASKATGGMFGPSKVDNLGFNPVIEAPKTAPAKPASEAAAPAGAKPAAPTTAGGITQPFQRLTPSK